MRSKLLLGLAAGSMLLAAAPAMAQDNWSNDMDVYWNSQPTASVEAEKVYGPPVGIHVRAYDAQYDKYYTGQPFDWHGNSFNNGWPQAYQSSPMITADTGPAYIGSTPAPSAFQPSPLQYPPPPGIRYVDSGDALPPTPMVDDSQAGTGVSVLASNSVANINPNLYDREIVQVDLNAAPHSRAFFDVANLHQVPMVEIAPGHFRGRAHLNNPSIQNNVMVHLIGANGQETLISAPPAISQVPTTSVTQVPKNEQNTLPSGPLP